MTYTRDIDVESGLRGLGSPQYLSGSYTRRPKQIEDHPMGYPRFSALIASHDSFYICRRFSSLRARLLLRKQDNLSILEERLEKIDRSECNSLRLGSYRRDDNEERQSVLSEIDKALSDYDTAARIFFFPPLPPLSFSPGFFQPQVATLSVINPGIYRDAQRLSENLSDDLIERSHRILALEDARQRSVSNLQNWVNGNGCVARAETAYLSRPEELVSVAGTDETIISWLETLIEDGLSRMRWHIGRRGLQDLSRDPNVYIPIKSSISRLTRVLMIPLIIALLLVPVIICNCLTLMAARVCTIVVATTVFVGVLSISTKAKAAELVVAGATYTTVLTVFVSTTGMP
ncbi:hypothetical protein M434DRAFT_395646 [Hypoxylon sp. CO27-5]|nr:hypothetical protein M434DRAFT_395646 [Hypoxylon sp. CO27-5]